MRTLKCMVLGALSAISMPATMLAQTVDLNLQKAIEIALAENPTIKIADKDIRLKEIADKEAWQSLLPTVSSQLALQHSIKVAAIKTPNGEFKMGKDGTTTATGGITLSLPIYAPAVYQNMKLTKDDILLAQEKARSSRLSLVNQVTKAYYAALLAKDSRDVIQRSYDVSKENFDVVDKKFQVGKVSEYDKISAEVQMRSMNSSVTSAQTGLELAILQLKVLMGINTDFDIVINDSLKAYENSVTLANTESNTNEIENNSSLRQIDMNMGLLKRTDKILHANFLPTIGMQISGMYQSYSNDDWNVFGYKYSPSSTLSISVNIPIFTASNWTKLKSSKIKMEQLSDTRVNTVRQLNMAAQSYRKNMLTSISKLESDRQAVMQADKAVSISAKRYDVGKGTILELNQSETALTQAELTYHQSIFDFLTNKADLDYTLGRE
ncbi:MAG: TolC family protein [Prevotella sp.]|nr:TolC family protein [Prevotella sp.]MDD7127688.1 TolC family protein [Prevotella sp.]MDY2804992.1 TolC family protein [Prevotella sp.]MDY3074979.1 TolC family protein [Prevotella sp.]MDY4751537.1 TolC family protein [Prevotella sp.]